MVALDKSRKRRRRKEKKDKKMGTFNKSSNPEKEERRGPKGYNAQCHQTRKDS